MISDNKKRIISLVLILVLICAILSGCGNLSENTEEVPDSVSDAGSIDSDDDGVIVPFYEIEYIRPDIDECAEQINEYTAMIEKSKTYDELYDVVENMDGLCRSYYTMYAYASVKHNMDMLDEYWEGENDYFDINTSRLGTASEKFLIKLSETEYKYDFDDILGKNWYANLRDADEETFKKREETSEEINALVNECEMIMSTESAEYKGREYSFSDAYSLLGQNNDVMNAWLDKYYVQIAEKYIEVVDLRNRLASLYYYDSVAEMYLMELSGDAYDEEMMGDCIDSIKDQLVPLYKNQLLTGMFFYPDVSVDYDAFSDVFNDILSGIDSDFANVYRKVEENGYTDLQPRDNKLDVGYTTYFYDYLMPFLFFAYEGDSYSIDSIAHEFGHCYSMYENDNSAYSIDVDEIFSAAMNLFVCNHYEKIVGETEALEMQYDTVAGMFDTIIDQSMSAELDMDIYSAGSEELSPDRLSEMVLNLYNEYGRDVEGYEEIYGRLWICDTHVLDNPFYNFPYVTSSYAALQLWEISLYDEGEAVKSFKYIVGEADNPDYSGLIHEAGISTIFDEGAVDEIAEMWKAYLID